MFSDFQFAEGQFADAKPVNRITPVPPTPVRPCPRYDCVVESDFALYSLQDAIPSRMPANVTPDCRVASCTVPQPPDIEIYSLQDRLTFNQDPITIIPTCPPGYACAPGTLPPQITFPPGTFQIPDPPQNGFPIVLQQQGCLSVVTRTLPATATQAEILAAQQSMILELANQQAICDSVNPPNQPPLPPAPSFLNQVVYFNVTCPEGQSVAYDGVLPSYITFEPTRLVLLAGYFGGASQAAANAAAQTFINNFGNAAIANGKLTCDGCSITTSSPLPVATQNVPYSVTLTYTNLTGTPTWSVLAGALPTGLSLNSATGEISGTPTVIETQGFTIRVTNGTFTCQKNFSLTVAEASTGCPLFEDIVWDHVTPFGNASGTAIDNIVSLQAGPADSGSCGVNVLGRVLYDGPELECYVKVEVSGDADCYISINQNEGFIILEWNYSLVSHVPGTYYIPFTIQATVGVSPLDISGTPGSGESMVVAGETTTVNVVFTIGASPP